MSDTISYATTTQYCNLSTTSLSTMDSESDISFDYEDGIDDDVYFSEGEVLISDTPYDHDEKTYQDESLIHSPNQLSGFWFRPLGLGWYIHEHFVSRANQLQSILPNFTIDELLVMLQYKKWLVDEVTGDYYVNWPKLREGCGLTDTRDEDHSIVSVLDFMCFICCESGNMPVFLLSCNHQYCADCYSQYVNCSIAQGGIIRCMHLDCNLSLLPKDIEMLMSHKAEVGKKLEAEQKKKEEEEEQEQEQEEDNRDFEDNSDFDDDTDTEEEYDRQFENVDLSQRFLVLDKEDKILTNKALINAARVRIDMLPSRYRWCPAPDCSSFAELVVNARTSSYDRTTSCDLLCIPIVTCASSHEFCFDCLYENHLPCPCWLVTAWVKKCKDDSETANWIDVNTQACVKCFTLIEKNGGCNHMTCSKCKYEFCWICLGDWAEHNSSYYKCNRYVKQDEDAKKKRSEKEDSLNRYLHFYKRFTVHQNSMNGDQHTLNSVHRYMLMYMKQQKFSSKKMASWNDIQFLSDAIRSLTSGRKTLMWTYAFAFYLKKSNLSEIFERMQDYLNLTVEELSGLFEKIVRRIGDAVGNIAKYKKDIVNLAALVSRRKQLLIECAHSELQLGCLQFFN